MKPPFTLLFLAASAAPATSLPPEVGTGTVGDRPLYTLKNEHVQLTFTTEIGGRILEFRKPDRGHNAVQPRFDNLHLDPEDDWPGADYGGMSDLATPGWPGPFWDKDFGLDHLSDREALVRAEAEGFAIERRMSLPAGSTSAVLQLKQTNVSEEPRSSVIRLHAELAVGERARTGDRIFFPGAEGVESFTYTIGAEYERFRWLELHEGWLAVADAVDEAVLLRTFSDGSSLPYRVFFWVGAAESAETLGYHGAFYAIDWFGSERALQPGESHQATESFHLIHGMHEVDFFSDGFVGSLTLQRTRGAADMPLEIAAAVGTHHAFDGGTVHLEMDRGEETSQPIGSLSLAAEAPGVAASESLDWTVPSLPDGPIQIRARFLDQSGELLAETSETFTVTSALVESATERMSRLEEAWAGLLARTSRKANALDVRTESAIQKQRMEKIRNAIKAGEYESAIRIANRGLESIVALEAVWGK